MSASRERACLSGKHDRTVPSPAWEIIVAPAVLKTLEGLSGRERQRIEDAIAGLEVGPREGGGKPLHGRPQWSLRVGGWRVLFRVDGPARAIYVTAVGSRGDIYKKP